MGARSALGSRAREESWGIGLDDCVSLGCSFLSGDVNALPLVGFSGWAKGSPISRRQLRGEPASTVDRMADLVDQLAGDGFDAGVAGRAGDQCVRGVAGSGMTMRRVAGETGWSIQAVVGRGFGVSSARARSSSALGEPIRFPRGTFPTNLCFAGGGAGRPGRHRGQGRSSPQRRRARRPHPRARRHVSRGERKTRATFSARPVVGPAGRIEGMSAMKSSELAEFLRAGRARVSPEDLGLAHETTRRRVPGLRREELARLAGVSVDYYNPPRAGPSPAAPRLRCSTRSPPRYAWTTPSAST